MRPKVSEKGKDGKGGKAGKNWLPNVCYAYNNRNETCKFNSTTCRFEHKCAACGKPKIPQYMCNHS